MILDNDWQHRKIVIWLCANLFKWILPSWLLIIDRLDGIVKRKLEKPASLEDWLQLPDDYDQRKFTDGKKRVLVLNKRKTFWLFFLQISRYWFSFTLYSVNLQFHLGLVWLVHPKSKLTWKFCIGSLGWCRGENPAEEDAWSRICRWSHWLVSNDRPNVRWISSNENEVYMTVFVSNKHDFIKTFSHLVFLPW